MIYSIWVVKPPWSYLVVARSGVYTKIHAIAFTIYHDSIIIIPSYCTICITLHSLVWFDTIFVFTFLLYCHHRALFVMLCWRIYFISLHCLASSYIDLKIGILWDMGYGWDLIREIDMLPLMVVLDTLVYMCTLPLFFISYYLVDYN